MAYIHTYPASNRKGQDSAGAVQIRKVSLLSLILYIDQANIVFIFSRSLPEADELIKGAGKFAYSNTYEWKNPKAKV